MRTWISILTLAFAAFSATQAFAASRYDAAYEKILLSRSLSDTDRAICAGKTGKEADMCRVTRAFIADIRAGADKDRFPPLADIAYAKGPAEEDMIIDRQP